MDLISWSKWAPGFPNGRGEDSQGTGGGPVSKTIRKLPKTMRKKRGREGRRAEFFQHWLSQRALLSQADPVPQGIQKLSISKASSRFAQRRAWINSFLLSKL